MGALAAARGMAGQEPGTATVRHLGTDDRSSQRVRIVDAALRCLARQGTAKTTADDIAREAGLSRATLYRAFPGGKDGVLHAVVETETARLFSDLAVAMGEARDLEDMLVAGMSGAAGALSGHAALGYLLEHEPGVVLPHLAFAEMDRLLAVASAFAAPFFGRWLEPEQAARAAEWAVRIVLAYLTCPATGADLTDPGDTRRLVSTFVIPGIQALRMTGLPNPTTPKGALP
ncbi:MAG TPA: helix-turn-helix domain-containing protein [Acidimicrobiales bacterium]|nr:helix-turn-helix domain-containing protein [Acidimicrobiales bacterium]